MNKFTIYPLSRIQIEQIIFLTTTIYIKEKHRLKKKHSICIFNLYKILMFPQKKKNIYIYIYSKLASSFNSAIH